MQYIGVCNTIDWNNLVDWLDIDAGYNSSANLPDVPPVTNMFNNLKNAGYNMNSIEWLNFYPDKDYDPGVTRLFETYVGATHIRSWISCVKPGKTAPWHWDWHQDDADLPFDDVVRYTANISPWHPGQAFFVKDGICYNDAVGSVYQWDHYTDYHAGVNASMVPKFQYNYVGLRCDM